MPPVVLGPACLLAPEQLVGDRAENVLALQATAAEVIVCAAAQVFE